MDAIILAGGIGKRAKLTYPKQLLRLDGKPILIHVLQIFRSISEIENIYVTVPDNIDEFQGLIDKYNIKATCILGGETRQESVYNALKYVKTEDVIIHESARPFINKKFVESLMYIKYLSIVPCIIPKDTIFNVDAMSYTDRKMICKIQLPQVFDTDKLKQAHEMGKDKNYTDDSSLLFNEMKITPYFTEGLEENIKITTPLDVKIAEVLYEECRNNNWW